jgi:thioredoxin 1
MKIQLIRRYSRAGSACLLAALLSAYTYKHADPGTRQEDPKITPEAYYKKITGTNKAILVYFSAGWCAVCPRFKPVIAEIEKEYSGKIEVLRIDTERDIEVAREFEVNTLPLLMLYKNGKKEWTSAGIIPIADIRREIDCYL